MELTNPADIRALLARHDFRFSKSMGQNFLTAAWVPADIADASGADEHTGVLEVGPGTGCLTEQLAQRAAKVVSVELDERLRPVLAETLAAYPNVEIVFGDVLALDLRQLAAEHFPGLRPVVCANLPYNVTTPLITAFLTAGCFDTVTVMIQREAAHRLCARPGTADYGLLTVLTAWYAELELLFDVPPHCFVPAPKVTSTVVRLRMRSAPPADVQDEALLFAVVRAAFSQRRKTLINALAAGVPGCDKARAAAAVAACGFDARVRGEMLDPVQFAALSNALRVELG